MKTHFVFAIIAFFSCQSFAQDQGLEVARKIDLADTGWGDEVVSSHMILRNTNGKEVVRTLQNRSLEVPGDGDKSIVLFDNPRDVKGTVFLSHGRKTGNDDQWLFIPALKRVKRISSSNRAGPFMGSEFAYEDVSSEEIERYTYRLLADQPCATFPTCFVLERVPVDKNSGYSKQLVYVDKEHYRIHKIEYYDRKQYQLKTLVRSNYQQFDRFWRAESWLMTNHQSGKSTQINWFDRQLGSGLKSTHFSASALSRIR